MSNISSYLSNMEEKQNNPNQAEGNIIKIRNNEIRNKNK